MPTDHGPLGTELTDRKPSLHKAGRKSRKDTQVRRSGGCMLIASEVGLQVVILRLSTFFADLTFQSLPASNLLKKKEGP